IARLSVLKKRRFPHPRDHKAIQKLNEKIDAKLATLQCPCPSSYSAKQAATDEEKIAYLWRKRRSRAKLTPNEDAAPRISMRDTGHLHLARKLERGHGCAY